MKTFPLLLLLIVIIGCKGIPNSNESSKQKLTADEKVYFPVALKYLRSVINENEELAKIMIGGSTGDSSLAEIKRSIERTKKSENERFTDYSKSAIPDSWSTLDDQLKEVHRALIESFDEYLTYWKDKKVRHISQGSALHKTALLKADKAVKDLTKLLESKEK